MWGLDLVGMMPKTSLKNCYVIVAIDYDTRFVVAKPVRAAMATNLISFLLENIHHFGTPRKLIMDHGSALLVKNYRPF